ncbi:hypothetical protein DSM112329_01582 [Paraconexibacter sp. AEG42_29]|uniref:DUF1385 domain-containing protein n=1 Tax=Paraconexibacter sp. AEG42_29 TaxID=2997339 RepID=A0AAU7ASZ4_9ACTN
MAVDEGTTAPAVGAGADGQLTAQRDAPLGGQAVLEGVMMRGVSAWAVAVRLPTDEQLAARARREKPDPTEAALGDIEVHLHRKTSVLARRRLLRIPVLRGVVALGESLGIGFKALNISVNRTLGEEDEEITGPMWVLTVTLALLMSVVLFFVIPVALTSLVKDQLGSALLFWLVEGVLRTAIFLGYLVAVSRLRDLRRLFEYHGAEHKTISCYEAGLELTPENAQRFSRLHPRCGTSFLLIVMIVAIFAFAPVGLPAWYLLVATRVLGVPLIAGLSFEIIKLTGRHRQAGWAKVVMWPGMQLQKLTTREPDLDQLAVAIAALNAVLETQDEGASADDLVGVEVVA